MPQKGKKDNTEITKPKNETHHTEEIMQVLTAYARHVHYFSWYMMWPYHLIAL